MDMEQFCKLCEQIQPVTPIHTTSIGTSVEQILESNIEQAKSREEERRANIETAENTAKVMEEIKIVIRNQNSYIALLEQQMNIQKKQLQILKDIFFSSGKEVEIEEQLKELIKQQIDDQHPLWDYVKDKGTDIAIAVLVNSVRMLLTRIGIGL